MSNSDSLTNVMKISSKALEAFHLKMQIAAENMANNKSANYAPKTVEFKIQMDRHTQAPLLKPGKIRSHKERTYQLHDPTHPQANEEGLVTLPKIDPLLSLLDLQQSKHDYERILKAYETANDLKLKLIQMMGG